VECGHEPVLDGLLDLSGAGTADAESGTDLGKGSRVLGDQPVAQDGALAFVQSFDRCGEFCDGIGCAGAGRDV
jgi:hypothetical protein